MDENGDKWDKLDGFVGYSRHAVDEKGRLMIPSGLRRGLSKQIIAVSFDPNYLALLSIRSWQESIQTKLKNIRITDRHALEFSRMVYSMAELCRLDKSGRVTISSRLRNWVNIVKDVVVFGHERWIEVWNAEEYERKHTRERYLSEEVRKQWEQLFF